VNLIEDVGDRTVLAGASSRTATRTGEPAERASASDSPADEEPAEATMPVDNQAPG
jgi:hypothetical protein